MSSPGGAELVVLKARGCKCKVCGVSDTEPDPLDAAPPYAWAYNNKAGVTEGDVDWYCHKVWTMLFKVRYPQRSDWIVALGRDGALFASFQEVRASLVEQVYILYM